MDVRIETLAPTQVAFHRHVGPYDDQELHRTWERLLAWAEQRGLLNERAKLVGISHDNPHVTPADKLRYDACIASDRPLGAEGEIGTQVLPGGDYAVVTHTGPYEGLTETYARLYGDWLPKSGREPADHPGFVVYRNRPRGTPPEKLVTDIYVPLRAR